MTDLAPCPFCGGYAEFYRMGGPRHSCIVECSDCGCRLETNEIWPNSGKQWNSRTAAPLIGLIQEYARDLRRNSSGGDDYPWEWAKATADYLEVLIARSNGAVGQQPERGK